MDPLEFAKWSKLEYEEGLEDYTQLVPRFAIDEIEKNRLTVVYGLRGVGKTTLMFQAYLKEPENKRIYISGDDLFASGLKPYDVVKAAVSLFGNDIHVFLDEITHIHNWELDVKRLFDKYKRLKITVSGSSAIGLMSSKKVLARRAVYLPLSPLSFREYIWITKKISIPQFRLSKDIYEDAIRQEIIIKEKIKKPERMFNVYLWKTIPYLLEYPNKTLMDLVSLSIYKDLGRYSSFKPEILRKIERMLYILAGSNKVTYSNLASDLGISKSTVGEMLSALEELMLLRRVFPYTSTRGIGRKEWKYYFTVPAIRRELATRIGVPSSAVLGYALEDIVVANIPYDKSIFFSDIDFVIGDLLIEVGAKRKDLSQISKAKWNGKKIVVYDGDEVRKSGDIVKLPYFIFLSMF